MKGILLFSVVFITSVSAYSNEQVIKKNILTYDQSESDSSSENFVKRWWNASRNKFSNIMEEGQNDLYVTGYAYHDRFTYTPEKLKELNEGAFGFGLGRSKDNESGNTEMLYAMTHLDSHSDVQFDAGFAWVKKFNLTDKFRLGIGYAAGLVSRSDFAGRIPIPYALPLATVDIGKVAINAILIPKLNDGINNGNVLFVFAKIAWDKNKSLLDF